MAGEGIFGDCVSGSYAWMDPGCVLESAGSDIGSAVTSALEPVWIILGIAVVIIILIGVLPNVKHIAPAVGRALL